MSKWRWSRAVGPLNRKKILIGRVRVSKWGWSMAMGMVDGHGSFEKEAASGWEGQGV